ncbi:hypothetical protein ASA1KI_25900 [Opitutales bacterium ASA1]|uniref:uracil-DNA glycosylase n=1 Tax=Congregicoccus parvus TaxID=3081749 RepID=UPI002B2A962C|nr:hypothetical protein ASA1KI_25900 [Opitutales bacterium ASA1]
MRTRIRALVDELKRLKRDGVEVVAVSEEALSKLRSRVGRAGSGERTASHAAPDERVPGSPTDTESRPSQVGSESPRSYAGSTGRSAAEGFRALLAAVDKPAPIAVTAPMVAKSATGRVSGGGGTLPPPPVVQLPSGSKRERWEWLRQRVLNCETCRAHTPEGLKVVFGVGDIDADVFFCGEAPGADEEIRGEPFVGAAGQLLTKMIGAMGLKREQVYIGNILAWRPQMEGRRSGSSVQQTGNRPPTEEEMRFGLPYLRAQVEVVRPKVIVALGSTAAEGLLGFGSFKSLGSIRGQWHEFEGTPLMVTYHPSYLLRNQSNKSKRVVWEDLLQVMERVGLPINERQRNYFL